MADFDVAVERFHDWEEAFFEKERINVRRKEDLKF
jgi:hypothetical protein